VTVTPVLVTRGDVPMTEIVASLVFDRPPVIWNNATTKDLGAYGRYAALDRVDTSHVYFQDDDCVVEPGNQERLAAEAAATPDLWVSNMRVNHNAGMPYLALPGYGAVAPVAAVLAARDRWKRAEPEDFASDDFLRVGCDIVIPVLCRSRMVDLGHESFAYAWDEGRTHRLPGYLEKKAWYYRTAAAMRGTDV